ncbi:cyclase family protein [Roseobacteraceae bacterium NS-SX3]
MTGWIDLTYELNADTWIYAEENYRDPPFAARKWCSVAEQRFEVWQLSLGTQTGTHMDAPSHFAEGGAAMEGLAAADCAGTFRTVRADSLIHAAPQLDWDGETHLLLDARDPAVVSPAAIEELLALPPKVWVLAGALTLAHPDPLWFHAALARVGKYLAEDLNTAGLGALPERGEIITMPLRLTGVSGSPARVLVRW